MKFIVRYKQMVIVKTNSIFSIKLKIKNLVRILKFLKGGFNKGYVSIFFIGNKRELCARKFITFLSEAYPEFFSSGADVLFPNSSTRLLFLSIN